MGWLFTIGFMIAGCVSGNTDAFICAGLFAIAGAIAFNCNSGSKQERLMGRKRGRPKKDFSKKYVVTIRLSELDLNRLAFIKDYTGKEKSEIIREGIDIMYDKAMDIFLNTEFQ